jgi:hypothetical protein
MMGMNPSVASLARLGGGRPGEPDGGAGVTGRAQFSLPLSSPPAQASLGLPMSSARPIEGFKLGVTVPWGHAEPVLGDACNSPMIANLPKAMGMLADDLASQGSSSRQSSTGAGYELAMAQMRAPVAAVVNALSRGPSSQDGRPSSAQSVGGTTVNSPRPPVASKPAARRGGGKDARAMAAARGGEGGKDVGVRAAFPWAESGGGARGTGARLPMMEFDGFTPGMSPTMGMGTLGMGGTDDMGMAEEYNDLSWLESELDQREARLSGPECAPAFSLAALPFNQPAAPPLLPELGKLAQKRKPAAMPRRRGKAAKGSHEGGKGGGQGGGKGSGTPAGMEATLPVKAEEMVVSEVSPLQPEGADAAERAASGMLNMGEIDDGAADTFLLGAIEAPAVTYDVDHAALPVRTGPAPLAEEGAAPAMIEEAAPPVVTDEASSLMVREEAGPIVMSEPNALLSV